MTASQAGAPRTPPGHSLRAPTPAALERRRVEAARLALCRRIAADLDAIEPAWHVMYRAGARQFMAVAMWDPGAPLALTDTDPHHLLAQMRTAERESHPARTGSEVLTMSAETWGVSGTGASPYGQGRSPGRTGRQPDGQFRTGG